MNRRTLTSLLIALAGAAPHTSAANLAWNNAAGGSAANAANWNPAQVPVAADSLFFSLSASYPVTLTAATPASTAQRYRIGTVTLSVTSPHSAASALFVSDGNFGAPATLNFVSGSMTFAGGCAIGTTNLANGTLNVSGGSNLQTTGTAINVGAAGVGVLSVTGNSTVGSNNVIRAGLSAGSNGTITVSGGSFFDTSLLVSSVGAANTGDIVIGESGTGSLTVAVAGQAVAGDDMHVGLNAGSLGVVEVHTQNGLNAGININDQLNIARNDVAAAAGTGTVLASVGGSIIVDGETRIGDPDGGTGTLRLNGGLVTTQSLTIDPGNGTLDLDHGTLTIDGGLFVPTGTTFSIRGGISTDTPMVRLINGGTLDVHSTLAVGTATSRTGRLEIRSGSEARTNFGGIALSTSGAANSNGSILVTGAGSLLHSAFGTSVGGSGAGLLEVTAAGRFESNHVDIAPNVGGSGTLSITGVGSQCEVDSRVAVGGTFSTAGGTGALAISNGAEMTIFEPGPTGLSVWPGGTVSVDNAALNVASGIILRGGLELNSGNVTTGTLISTGTITGSGTIDASLNGSVDVGSITLTGPMTIGPSGTTGYFDWLSTLNVGSHTLNIRNPDISSPSRLGRASLSGGSITMLTPGGRFSLANGDTLTGHGTINGDLVVFLGSQIAPTGGMVFNGVLSAQGLGDPISVNGGNVQFVGPASGISGRGTLNCVVNANNATITATGPLSLGTGGSVVVGLTNSRVNVGAHTVTLNTQFLAGSGASWDLRGGTLDSIGAALSLLQTPNREFLRGFGTIASNLIHLGTIEPAGPDLDLTGQLTIQGTYAMTATSGSDRGTLVIDLDASDHDRVVATGSVTATGHLVVNLAPGFTPAPGQSWVIVRSLSNQLNDVIQTVSLPPRCLYSSSSSAITISAACIADIDVDGDSDSDDVIAFFAAFESGEGAADVDGDGDTDSDDILTFFSDFESGC